MSSVEGLSLIAQEEGATSRPQKVFVRFEQGRSDTVEEMHRAAAKNCDAQGSSQNNAYRRKDDIDGEEGVESMRGRQSEVVEYRQVTN